MNVVPSTLSLVEIQNSHPTIVEVCMLKVIVSFSGLFSKSLLPELVKSSILDESSCLIVEPVVDAIIKLGQFIGDKLYTTNIYNCPCHPI